MFDIAWSEMLVIGAVALVVIGPKDLPKALRSVGEAVGKIRRMASEFQNQFNDAMREAELHDIKKQVEEVGGTVQAATRVDFNPIQTIREELKGATTGAAAADSATTVAHAGANGAESPPATMAEPTLPLPEIPPPVSSADIISSAQTVSNAQAPEPQPAEPVAMAAPAAKPVGKTAEKTSETGGSAA